MKKNLIRLFFSVLFALIISNCYAQNKHLERLGLNMGVSYSSIGGAIRPCVTYKVNKHEIEIGPLIIPAISPNSIDYNFQTELAFSGLSIGYHIYPIKPRKIFDLIFFY